MDAGPVESRKIEYRGHLITAYSVPVYFSREYSANCQIEVVLDGKVEVWADRRLGTFKSQDEALDQAVEGAKRLIDDKLNRSDKPEGEN